jgi:hypothetical protein
MSTDPQHPVQSRAKRIVTVPRLALGALLCVVLAVVADLALTRRAANLAISLCDHSGGLRVKTAVTSADANLVFLTPEEARLGSAEWIAKRRSEHGLAVFVLPSQFAPDPLAPQVRVEGWHAFYMPAGVEIGSYLEVGWNGSTGGFSWSRLFAALNPNITTYNVCDAGQVSILERPVVFDDAVLRVERVVVDKKPTKSWRR